jgi:DNA-binding CsgD family transcriptional regulator
MLPDKAELSDIIASVYDAVGGTELWETFLGKLAQTFHADSAALVLHEAAPEVHILAASWMLDPESSRRYQTYYGALDVWTMRALQSRLVDRESTFTSESLCAFHELAETEFYNDFLAKQGIAHGLFGLVEKDPLQRYGSVSLYRGSSSGEFQMSDVETLNFLVPHIQRAFTLHSRFSKLKARSEGIENALNLLATGVIFVGTKGEIIFLNNAAREMLRRREGLLLVHGRLSAVVEIESSRLQTLIFEATQTSNLKGLSPGGTILVSRKTARPLSVTVAPLRNNTINLAREPFAVLFICDPDAKIELPSDLLRRCYGLTIAEARLTVLLLEGRSLKVAASRCGVTHNTAKSQLKSVFSKTQVNRQCELIKLFMPASLRHTR